MVFEIYTINTILLSVFRYTRLMVPPLGAPLEKDMDAFLDVFRVSVYMFFSK